MAGRARRAGRRAKVAVVRAARAVSRRVSSRGRRAAAAIVVATPAPVRRVVRRAGAVASRGGRYVGTKFAERGINIRQMLVDGLMNAAGGIVSAGVNQAAKITDTTMDDSPLFQVSAKGIGGVVLKYLMKDRRGVHEFVAGLNGHSAGAAADQWVISKITKKALGL